MERIILHVDLDAFYASLEELRRPDIRGKPVVVCVYSGRSADSGAVATSNYPARELGIRAGMPIAFAKRAAKGKDVVFLPVDMEHYREVSGRIMDLLEEHADRFQQVSIDEAYLDVSDRCAGSYPCAEKIAREIRGEIKTEEGITCSVGIGPNKYVSKMAGKRNKPDGLTVVKPGEVVSFLKDLPAGKLHGVGEKTAEELNFLGVKTAADMTAYGLAGLEKEFGKNKAKLLRDKALGIDDSPVEQKEKQQLSRIATLKEDTDDPGTVYKRISELCADLNKKMQNRITFRTVSLITIDSHLQTQTRSETIPGGTDACSVLPSYRALIDRFFSKNPGKMLRRVGIRVSNLSHKEVKDRKEQKSLFDF
ncbi:MAG: DNA polymerase IV [Candidatus Altiarchaeia archaeon]